MLTKLHWVDGPWRGKLALAARPRGGDWLPDEMKAWRQAGVDSVVSLLTSEEEADLDLVLESFTANSLGMTFLSFPIPDRQVPHSDEELTNELQLLEIELDEGRNVVLHCRQGIGRTGLVAACLLLTKGMDTETAIARLSAARGVSIPETPEQRTWIDHYAGVFSASITTALS
jgi:protein-tyrosine phosphatase